MRMRRNWSKRLTALMLAILAFAALGTVALADETDPEKDLVIGFAYGGGESPGENDFVSEPDGPFELTDDMKAEIDQAVAAEYSVEGFFSGTSASGMVYARYGRNPMYYNDGSWSVDVQLKNTSDKDIILDWTLNPVNEYGALLEVLDMGTYSESSLLKSGYTRSFTFIFPERPKTIGNHICLMGSDDAEYDALKFLFEHDAHGSAYSVIKTVSADDPIWSDPIWDDLESGVVTPCESCGTTSSVNDTEQGRFDFWFWIIGIGIAVVGFGLSVFFINLKFKKKGAGH